MIAEMYKGIITAKKQYRWMLIDY